jgi:hypothetical protein
MSTPHAVATMRALDTIWRDALAASVYGDHSVDVYLGPLVSGDPDDAVFIGYDGDPEGAFSMTQHTQNWRTLGTRARDEEFDIFCCILTMTGRTDGPGVLDAIERLYGIYATCADAVHRDPSLGIGPGSAHNAPYFKASVRAFSTFIPTEPERGAIPRVQFSVHVETRV